MHNKVEIETAAEDIPAEEAAGNGLIDSPSQYLLRRHILAAEKDVGLAGTNGIGGDDHAFDQ